MTFARDRRQNAKMVFVLGDVHGDFSELNNFINKKIRLNRTLSDFAEIRSEDGLGFEVVILQCGDFAYFWPRFDSSGKIKNEVSWLPGGRVPLYWTGGNHEDWDRLDSLLPPDRSGTGGRIREIDAGIYYCGFGATLSLSPGVTVLFAGGAESSDKMYRLRKMAEGYPKIWWKQEGISEADMALLDTVSRADWVVSHTAPAAFTPGMKLSGFNVFTGDQFYEPSREFLDEILWKYHPKRWFFGHYHRFMKGETDGCQWEALSELRGDGPWDKIYLEY